MIFEAGSYVTFLKQVPESPVGRRAGSNDRGATVSWGLGSRAGTSKSAEYAVRNALTIPKAGETVNHQGAGPKGGRDSEPFEGDIIGWVRNWT